MSTTQTEDNPLFAFAKATAIGQIIQRFTATAAGEKATTPLVVAPGIVVKEGIAPPKPGEAEGSLAKPFVDLVDGLFKDLKDNPSALSQTVRQLLATVALLASTASFIPFTNNLGGALAATTINNIIEPFRHRAYAAGIDLFLKPVFPTQTLSPRLVVSGVERGAIDEQDLIDELGTDGTLPASVLTAVKIARVNRFREETRDDLVLLRQYHLELTKATILTEQDQLRATLNDLRDQRKELQRDLRRVRSGGRTPS